MYALDGTMRSGWPQVDHATCDPPEPAEPCWDFGGYNQNIGLADLDADGYLDVVSSYDAIGFGIFHRDGVKMARKRMWVQNDKAIRELSLPQTPPEEALGRAVAWFKEKGYV